MTDASVPNSDTLTLRVLRWAPAVAALTLTLAITASVGSLSTAPPDPRALAMVELGRDAMSEGDANAAIDAFEAALALDPGYAEAFVALADATRTQGLPGKSIDYYRRVLERDPSNHAALAGHGQALVAQGAIAQAERNLALLRSRCGRNCAETEALRLAIQQDRQASLAAGEGEDGAPQ